MDTRFKRRIVVNPDSGNHDDPWVRAAAAIVLHHADVEPIAECEGFPIAFGWYTDSVAVVFYRMSRSQLESVACEDPSWPPT